MPKAKFKRKGVPIEVIQKIEEEDRNKLRKTTCGIEVNCVKIDNLPECSLLLVPEEIICIILEHLPGWHIITSITFNSYSILIVSVLSIARVEQTCKHFKTVINQARVWRKLLLNILDREPGLVDFIPDVLSLERNSSGIERSVDPYKRLFCELKLKLNNVWSRSDSVPSISR